MITKRSIQALAAALLVAWACLACTSSTDDAAQRLRSESTDECGRAADYPDQPGRLSATRSQLLITLDCRLATLSPDVVAAFDREGIYTFHSNDQLRVILQTLESIPDRGDDVGHALAILFRGATNAGIPQILGPAFRPVLRELIDDVLTTHPDAFTKAFDLEVLEALTVDQLLSIYTTIIDLPRETEHLLANIEVVHNLASSTRLQGDLVSSGYARALRDAVVSLLDGFNSSFAETFDVSALNHLSLDQLKALRSTILALPSNAQPTSVNLEHVYEGLRNSGATVDLVANAYKSSLIGDVTVAIVAAHPNLQRVFRHDGLQYLSVIHLRAVLETIGSLMDGGRDAQDALASIHAALVRNGLSTGASGLGYRDLLVRQIDAVVGGMHENFQRVFDRSALDRSPIEHLEFIHGTLQDLLPSDSEDGEATLIAIQAAGQRAGLNLDIGYSRLIAEQRAPLIAAIEQTLEGMSSEFVDAFSTTGMTTMSPEVLQAVLRELESLPDRGSDVVGGLSQVLAAAVAAGHVSTAGDFGIRALRTTMQATLTATIASLDESVRAYLKMDTVRDAGARLSYLQTVLAAVLSVRDSRDPVEALAAIHVAAIEAGEEVTRANFGLTDAVVDKLRERFSDDRILSRTGTAEYVADQVDAVALAVFRTASRFYVPTAEPVRLIEAMHASAVRAGMNPDATDFGKENAVNLLTPVRVTRTWVTEASTGEAVFRWNMVNHWDVGIKAIRFALYAYDSFGGTLGGGCLPFPARGELRLTRSQQYGRSGQGVGGLSWWWKGRSCTARADRFDLRILDVVFLDDSRWTP